MSDTGLRPLPSGGFAASAELVTAEEDWRQSSRHQLHYIDTGLLIIELARSAWYVFPGRAAWVSANVHHRALIKQPTRLRTVYLPRETMLGPLPDCATLSPAPLARDMTDYALRFGSDRSDDARADRFFCALADMARD